MRCDGRKRVFVEQSLLFSSGFHGAMEEVFVAWYYSTIIENDDEGTNGVSIFSTSDRIFRKTFRLRASV
jgi:hypothetical protein